MSTDRKPTTHCGDLAKLPPALAPLVARPQWCIWRWTTKPDGSWQKPPFVATDPGRNASSTDSSTWTDYATALAAVQAGHGNGITYVLTKNDPYAAVDLDHCRDAGTGSIDRFAQNFLTRSRGAYESRRLETDCAFGAWRTALP
jgi:primase-polymerase (primpol)-like protein